MKDEDDAFLEAMDGVQPLSKGARDLVASARREPTVGQLQRQLDAVDEKKQTADPNYLTLGEVKQVHPFDVLGWKKDGVQPDVFKKLANGKYPIEATLDLHRRTLKEARADMFKFIGVCQAKGWRSVIVAHGRGDKSPTPARLKSYVAHWMHQIPEVIAYHSAPRALGGTGASFVLLRKSAKIKEENRERYGNKSDADE